MISSNWKPEGWAFTPANTAPEQARSRLYGHGLHRSERLAWWTAISIHWGPKTPKVRLAKSINRWSAARPLKKVAGMFPVHRCRQGESWIACWLRRRRLFKSPPDTSIAALTVVINKARATVQRMLASHPFPVLNAKVLEWIKFQFRN